MSTCKYHVRKDCWPDDPNDIISWLQKNISGYFEIDRPEDSHEFYMSFTEEDDSLLFMLRFGGQYGIRYKE